MCGICGFYNYETPEREALLREMTDSLAHRGPDGSGAWLDDRVALGHRRLAIIDPEGGHQPMISADNRYITICNGEIYNFVELMEELSARGCEFRTRSDTEVIAEAIREWGVEKAINRFRGMFAFAVYDTIEKTLIIGRDPLGIKPLYYAKVGDGILFASEQKALLKNPRMSRKIDHVALHDFFTLGFPITPQTCWREISMFPPGHFCVVKPSGEFRLTKYWSWQPESIGTNLEDALAEAEASLKDSLKYHLRSDVPLAAFLSGGIDSSLLVFFLLDGLLDNLKTFNVGFAEADYDESEAAAEVARISRSEHYQLKVGEGAGDPDLFETILAQYDEPFGDSSCLPTYLISREMRKEVKTVISGDGGDELFGGYHRFQHIERILNLGKIPGTGLLKPVLSGVSPLLGDDLSRRLNKALDWSRQDPESLFCLLHTYFTEEERDDIYTPEFKNELKSVDPTWKRMNHFLPKKSSRPGEELAGLEMGLNLHADYLRKVDIASSAHGLEVRVPFLDRKVWDFAAKLPFDFKVKAKECKYLLRELAKRRISPNIGSKAKQGFGIPFDRWCGKETIDYLGELLFENPNATTWRIFQKSTGDKLWSGFKKAEAGDHQEISRYQIYQRLFMLASTEIWFKRLNPDYS